MSGNSKLELLIAENLIKEPFIEGFCGVNREFKGYAIPKGQQEQARQHPARGTARAGLTGPWPSVVEATKSC